MNLLTIMSWGHALSLSSLEHLYIYCYILSCNWQFHIYSLMGLSGASWASQHVAAILGNNSFLSLTPPGGLKAMEDCTDPRMTLLQHRWCTLNKFKEMRPVRVCFRMTSLWKSKKIMCVLSIRYYNRLLTHKHQQVVQVYMASCLQGDDSLIKNGEVTWVTPQNASRHLWRSQLITSSSCPLQLEGYVNKAFSFP